MRTSLKVANRQARNIQKGFSLIELMIAMLIGLFLLTGIASSYLSSKQASINRNQTSALEDNGRLALEIISKSLEHTGYSSHSGMSKPPFIRAMADISVDTCPNGTNNVVDATIFRATVDNATGDSIGVIFNGDDNAFTDCSGHILAASLPSPAVPGCRLKPLPDMNSAPESSKIYNSFFIDKVNDTLECSGSRSEAAVTIADGVENIQFLYGLDQTASDGIVDKYVRATDIAANEWNSVISIQVAILVRSLKPIKNISESKTYTLLDIVHVAPDDKYQRAVFSSTIHLRNTL